MNSEGNKRPRFYCCSLFNYFCCPPCPKQITEKLVFIPPSPPLYELDLINKANDHYVFLISPDCNTSGFKSILKQEARFVKTSQGNDIVVLYVKCTNKKKFTAIYSHGNAVDLGQIHKLCVELSLVMNCDVVSYDYSGYGQSNGQASENNLYADIKAAWDYTLTFHEPRPEKIILFGQSLGTAPTIDLASKVQCAGVILQSAFSSSMRVACSGRKCSGCMDKFNKYGLQSNNFYCLV